MQIKYTGLKDESGTEIKHGDYLIEYCNCSDTGMECAECESCVETNTLYRCMYHPEEARFKLEELEDSETGEFDHLTGYHIGDDHPVTNGVLDGFQVIGNIGTHDLLCNRARHRVELRTK